MTPQPTPQDIDAAIHRAADASGWAVANIIAWLCEELRAATIAPQHFGQVVGLCNWYARMWQPAWPQHPGQWPIPF